MNLAQRQEQSVPTISGRKIKNYFTCTTKEVKRLSPQPYEQAAREVTFQTDSFKQILTKRSGCQVNKENISVNNKMMKKIKEQPASKQAQDNKKKSKSTLRPDKKSSAVSLTKIFQRNRSANEHRKKETKSVSPSRDLKDYRSGPTQRKNYLSNNTSSKIREIMPSKSQKCLTDRMKNQLKSININKKQQKKEVKKQITKQLTKTKKTKNQSSKLLTNNKKNINLQKTQGLAKQFDSLLKTTKTKVKKSSKKNVSTTSKQKKKKSKQKKVIVSHNNSKNLLSKHRMNSDFSDESHDSPDKVVLSTRYDGQKLNATKPRHRLSFDPTKKKGKSKQKAKTEALSPEKSLANKNEAATIIQKVFRGYLTRKYISQFKNIITSVIKIQAFWRGYRARKYYKQLKLKALKDKKQKFKFEKFLAFSQSEGDRKLVTPRQNQLNSLLEEILNEQNVNETIKSRINHFLKKQQRGQSSKSSSAMSLHHMEQQMRSQKRYFQQIDKKKHKFGSPSALIKYSPKLQKSDLHKSPQLMLQNLLAIKQFQRQKLINNARMQMEGLDNLALKSIFSPRTRDMKKLQVHRKLGQDLSRFDQSMTQVIKSCRQSEDIVGQIKPFSNTSTPERANKIISLQKPKVLQTSPQMNKKNIQTFELKHQQQNQRSSEFRKQSQYKLGSPQRKLQDLSMQLLQYYQQKTQAKNSVKEYQKIDCSYQFIEQYLLALFEYLQQLGQPYWLNFITIMRSSRNLQITCFLKNLNVLTQESEYENQNDEDLGFKLPMYKYLGQSEPQVLQRRVVQQFNSIYKKLQRNQLGTRGNLQDIYLKMIVDAVNEALNLQRPNVYLFTETSLGSKINRIRLIQMEVLSDLEQQGNEAEFSFYFASSMNYMYKWAHLQCGRMSIDKQEQKYQNQDEEGKFKEKDQNGNNFYNIDNSNNGQAQLYETNEQILKQFLKLQVEKHVQQNYYDQLLEVVVALSNHIFDEIILEEGIELFL